MNADSRLFTTNHILNALPADYLEEIRPLLKEIFCELLSVRDIAEKIE